MISEVQATGSFLSTTLPGPDQPYQHHGTSRGATSLSLSLSPHIEAPSHGCSQENDESSAVRQVWRRSRRPKGTLHTSTTTQPPAVPVVHGLKLFLMLLLPDFSMWMFRSHPRTRGRCCSSWRRLASTPSTGKFRRAWSAPSCLGSSPSYQVRYYSLQHVMYSLRLPQYPHHMKVQRTCRLE